jgi:hypothetical protein
VNPAETARVRVVTAAARNNAGWCASVCASHGIPHAFGDRAWHSPHRTPPYYPDAVTVRPDATAADFLSRIDTASPGCSVKDSFATLDLTSCGFTCLFSARWIHRPAGLAAPASPNWRAEQVSTSDRLRDWQDAWHGAGAGPDVFRPALLDDPSVRVLALHDGGELRGGAVLYRGSGLVGVSNLFAVDGGDVAAVRSSVIAAAARRFPGLPLAGYEREDALAHALAVGFTALAPLRVWSRVS